MSNQQPNIEFEELSDEDLDEVVGGPWDTAMAAGGKIFRILP